MVKQLSLFKQSSFNITRELKECMAGVVVGSGLSREEFLDRMNALADRFGVRLMKGNGQGLTMATFEKWLNPADKDHIPSPVVLPVFCEVGGSAAPLQVMAGPVGAMVIGEQDRVLLQWAREYQKAKEARRIMKRLESEI